MASKAFITSVIINATCSINDNYYGDELRFFQI